MSQPYEEPVAQLVPYTADIARLRAAWPDYVGELGLSEADIDEVARLARDEASRSLDPDEPSFWAQVHAWRALAQLRSPRSVEAILAAVEGDPDDDWACNELPFAAATVGPAAVPLLEAYIRRQARRGDTAVAAAEALCEVSLEHPVARDQVVLFAAKQLASYRDQDPALNAFLMGCLLKNEAVEWLPLIEAAFAAEAIDEFCYGDIHDIRFEFGVGPRPGPRTERRIALSGDALGLEASSPAATHEPTRTTSGSADASSVAKAKARAKAKAAKVARKKNRRR